MSEAEGRLVSSGNPEHPRVTTREQRRLRSAQLLRAGALLAIGFGIAFSATLHEQLAFDRGVMTIAFALIGLSTLIEYLSLRGTAESWWVAARAVVAFAGAGALIAVVDTAGLALVVAVWALLTALITIMRLTRGAQPGGAAIPSALLSAALAVAVLIVRDDAVAIIGFFGTYAVIRGVFLGIAAFDLRAHGGDADRGGDTTPGDAANERAA
ncbi:hypothetical protein J4H92_04730 [Leucobacter weissii]|uniref:Uncharacterized protein n=1 Tax=Leucobacter weissii TaxID=1983706 RepID=A0A939MMM8_9MICO|nr:hypothetical protein [Leucobacter weissii]MBO1901251.1 hypothetical protein [Leucobacter weissii]